MQNIAREVAKKKQTPASDKPRKMTLAERKELEGMEAAILVAEQKVLDLENTLNDPDFHSTRFHETPAILAALDLAKAECAALYSRWEQLETLASTE